MAKPTQQNIESSIDGYKGIARCSFQWPLRLDDHIEVQHAHDENGLLSIELQRIMPEKK